MLNAKITYNRSNLAITLLIFIISTRSSGLANSNLLLFGTLLFVTGLAYLRKIKPDKSFFYFVVGFSIILFQNFIHLGSYFDPMRNLKLIALITISYLSIKLLKLNFFFLFNKITAWTILLSFPFYIWQLIYPSSLHSMGLSLNSIFRGLMDVVEIEGNTSLNIIVYTIEFVENFRNSGPMWEPGGFSTLIALSLYFELLMSGLKFNKRCYLYLIGIITTFSTTGYLITIIILLWYFMNRARNERSRYIQPLLYFFLPIVLFTSVYVFFTTPIFYEKITEQIDIQNEILENLDEYGNEFQSLGRFGSLQKDLESIQDTPLFGRGYTDGNFREAFENFNFTNGLSSFIGRMGLVGLLWLLISLYKSGKIISAGLSPSPKGMNIIPLLVLVISFSNPVLFTPVYLMLQLFFIPFKLIVNPKSFIHELTNRHRGIQQKRNYTQMSGTISGTRF